MPGTTAPMRPIQSSETTPANKPLMAKAAEMMRFAGTPSMRAIVKLVAAARMAIPKTERRMSQEKSTSNTTAAAMVMRLRAGVMTTAMCTVSEKISGRGTLRGRGETKRRAAFWSRVEKAKEMISTAVTDFARTGRKAT